jgi:hypothetical protein
MKVLEGRYRHPIRGDGMTLAVFQREGGYLAMESRDGAVTVFATLGLFDRREGALGRVAARGQELKRQGYQEAAGVQ